MDKEKINGGQGDESAAEEKLNRNQLIVGWTIGLIVCVWLFQAFSFLPYILGSRSYILEIKEWRLFLLASIFLIFLGSLLIYRAGETRSKTKKKG